MGPTAFTLSLDSSPRPPRASSAHLFLVLGCDRLLASPMRLSLARVEQLAIGRARSDQLEVERGPDGTARLGVPDPRMSHDHARLQHAVGGWLLLDAGSKNGTWVDGVGIDRQALPDGAFFAAGHTLFRLRTALEPAPDALAPPDAPPGLRTLLPHLHAELERLRAIAASEVPVLLLGETGTGKELLAGAVHALSGRPGSFQPVNCGALPQTLLESLLFGHRKGAFSGADQDRAGLISAAERGTLFLDEIGDLALPSQAALLRVLQSKEVTPLGSTRGLPVDFRLVAATHRDLPALAAEDRFRPDLLARLQGFTLRLLPLRERLEDLGLFIASILSRLPAERAARVSLAPEAARALVSHRWPANVRELERCILSAEVLAGGERIQLQHLPEEMRAPPAARADAAPPERPLSEEEAQRRAQLLALLQAQRGNVAAVARELGKARNQIHRWLRRYGIDPATFR